jgi:N-methylhydantoinase B
MKRNFDPIRLEVIRNALYSVSDEMSAALVRTAYSTNIKDRRDCSSAVFLVSGEVAAQSEIGTPLHLGVMPAVVQTVLGRFSLSDLHPGDDIIVNQPYPAGPGHLNDITLVSPVYWKRRLVALTANQAHHVDVGGYAPGSMPFGVTEIFQEGLQIPPVKIVKSNVVDEEIAALISDNVRTKSEFRGDLLAQVACNNVGEKRLVELVDKYGPDDFLRYIKEILNYSERLMREGIRRIPDGSYSFEDFIEGDSITDARIKIAVTVRVQGDEVTADFTGSSPQVQGPLNCRPASTAACVFYVMKCIVDPGLPPNSGAYRPIHIIAPAGSILNAQYPASTVHSNIITTHRVVDTLLGAFIQAVPERVMAAHHGTQNMLNIGGLNPRTGKLYSYVETYGGGQGAFHNQDGMDGVHSHMTNTRNAPVEVIEAAYPLRIESYGLVPDSEGPGRYRGGVGMQRAFTFLAPESTITCSSDRNEISPWGVFGGRAASPARCLIRDQDGQEHRLPSKITRRVVAGEGFRTVTSGGGGWGPPAERDPEKVRWDVLEGLVSLERASSEYKVVIDRESYEIDWEKTRDLRSAQQADGKRTTGK